MTEVLKEPVSPCLGICRLDPDMQYCVGCLRTLDELRDWTSMSREQKHALIRDLEARRQQQES